MPTTKLTKALGKLKTRYIWAKRAIEYGFNYYVLEKPRGLDFSKRERRQKATPDSTGYALTSKKRWKTFLMEYQLAKTQYSLMLVAERQVRQSVRYRWVSKKPLVSNMIVGFMVSHHETYQRWVYEIG